MIALLLPALWPISSLLPAVAQDAERVLDPTPVLPICIATAEGSFQEEGKPDETLIERARRLAREKAAKKRGELDGPDGKPILPGQLPPTATPEARARWQALLDGILASNTTKPIESFRLGFYLRHRNLDNQVQSNDAELEFDYLAPGFLRAELESGRMHLRGPEGDFLIDNREVIPLIGREGAEDQRQIDEMAAIAHNFVGLTDPRTLRIAELSLSEAPLDQLPIKFVKEAEELSWLSITSPDFFLYRGARGQDAPRLPLYRARLGIDLKTQEVRLAVIHEERGGGLILETAALVRLLKHSRRNGFLVPHRLELFDIDLSVQPWRFRPLPTSELTMKEGQGSLRARLRPEDFLPPVKKPVKK